MNNQEINQKVGSILNDDPRLASMWSLPPSAMFIPYKGTREAFFVLVSISLRPEMFNLNDLAYVCLSALRLLVTSDALASAAGGLEIVPYVIDGTKTLRVLRLSIERDGLLDSLRLTEGDLLNEMPLPGVRCGWYVEKPNKRPT